MTPTTEPGAPGLEARLRQRVERWAVPRHQFANARANAWVRDELFRALAAYDLEVQLQGRYQNVVALPRKTTEPLTLIAAHYDSVPNCPGADDNGSGLAVMLECAHLLAGLQLPVGFIAFNAEEDGLLGSRDFVTNGLPALALEIRAIHVLEMVGFRGDVSGSQSLPLPWVPAKLERPDFVGLLTNGPSNPIADTAIDSSASPRLRLVTAKTWGPLHKILPDITRSDHFPFWSAGIPAALWTDTANFRNPNYHQPTDTPDTLDYAFMREVTELLCAIIAPGRRPR